MTYHERMEYQQLINAWINTIERKHEEYEILKRVRMKRQRKAEWIEQRNRLPKLTADVYLDRENVDNILKGGMAQAEDKQRDVNTDGGIVNMGRIDDHDGFKNRELVTPDTGCVAGAAVHDQELFQDISKPFVNPNRRLETTIRMKVL